METKTYNKYGMSILMGVGLIGTAITGAIACDFSHITADLSENDINIISMVGDLLYTIPYCLFLYFTMSQFEAEKIKTPSKGVFIAAIIVNALFALITCLTDNLENMSGGVFVLTLLCAIANIVIIILLVVGFFKAGHGVLGILLIVAPIVQFVAETWITTNSKWIMLLCDLFIGAPFFYFATMLSDESEDKTKTAER